MTSHLVLGFQVGAEVVLPLGVSLHVLCHFWPLLAAGLKRVGQLSDVPQVARPQSSSLHPGHNRAGSV